jgi:cell division protease FtsH
MLIEGQELPPLNPPSNGSASGDPEVKVLKPEPGRAPGFPEGSPSPA